MNPYKEDGLRARLSFDPAYCKRCTGPPSVNDGYITGPGYGRRRRMLSAAALSALSLRCAVRPAARSRAAPGGRHAPPAPRARPLRRETLSPRLKLSFGNAATGPL